MNNAVNNFGTNSGIGVDVKGKNNFNLFKKTLDMLELQA